LIDLLGGQHHRILVCGMFLIVVTLVGWGLEVLGIVPKNRESGWGSGRWPAFVYRTPVMLTIGFGVVVAGLFLDR
jgi:hypothetical protein